jgi:hypothetical protein
MKKPIQYLLRSVLLILLPFFLLHCNKDEEPKTTSELLIGTWSLTAEVYTPTINFGSGPVTDYYPYYENCEKDNVIIFKANSEGEFNEGATKCDAADPQTVPFLWTLQNNNTKLSISAIVTMDILQLDDTTLKLKYPFDFSGVNYTITETYVRK